MDTVEDLYERYKKVDKDYEKRIDKYGAVGWIIEKLPDSRTIKEVSEKQLPLKLPNVKSYAPAGTGESPLSTVKSWVTSGYETNTMPGWAGSSWYFLRYTDPTNSKKFADSKELDYWFGKNGGVNMYVGGAEHATGHLLYSRFWHKVLHDLGHVKSEEPFMKLRNQGMIGGADGRKMSKRWGNVVNPDDVVKQFGADTMRVYEAFVGPFESDLPWSTDGIVGSRRFIERIWRFQEKVSDTAKTPVELQKSLHKTIKKVTDDIATFSFNTAVSAMMIFANELEKHESINVKDFKKFIQILAPFAPYITDELWNTFGEKKSIHHATWPKFDPKLTVDDTFTIGIQINGKTRAEITISHDISQQELEKRVFAIADVQKWINNSEVKKFIYVKGRIINIVI
jgi:leucyl-tRNA synthetase